MQNISRMLKRAINFWRSKVKENDLVIYGSDFPDEYVRKILQREDLALPVKKGLYLLKHKGDEVESVVYGLYWPIIEKILKVYEPWSIEKDSALALYLGDESIPQKLFVRTARKVKYSFMLPLGLKVQIRPDSAFHEKTRRDIKMGKAKIYLDVPEKVLFTIKKRKGIKFAAFIRGVKFDRRMLEVLYSAKPKPIVARELIEIANRYGRVDLGTALKDILRKYTIYRF